MDNSEILTAIADAKASLAAEMKRRERDGKNVYIVYRYTPYEGCSFPSVAIGLDRAKEIACRELGCATTAEWRQGDDGLEARSSGDTYCIELACSHGEGDG